jgi:hypothetical protein
MGSVWERWCAVDTRPETFVEWDFVPTAESQKVTTQSVNSFFDHDTNRQRLDDATFNPKIFFRLFFIQYFFYLVFLNGVYVLIRNYRKSRENLCQHTIGGHKCSFSYSFHCWSQFHIVVNNLQQKINFSLEFGVKFWLHLKFCRDVNLWVRSSGSILWLFTSTWIHSTFKCMTILIIIRFIFIPFFLQPDEQSRLGLMTREKSSRWFLGFFPIIFLSYIRSKLMKFINF